MENPEYAAGFRSALMEVRRLVTHGERPDERLLISLVVAIERAIHEQAESDLLVAADCLRRALQYDETRDLELRGRFWALSAMALVGARGCSGSARS